MPTKEDVYDAEISPLVEQIIRICQRSGIAMVASFSIPTPALPDMHCSTIVSDEQGELSQPLQIISTVLQRLGANQPIGVGGHSVGSTLLIEVPGARSDN